MAEIAPTLVTKPMVYDLILEIRDQVTSLDALMQETLAEARAINDESRAWRERSPFRAGQQGDLTKSC
jgi:hypothetical protein